MATTTGRPVRVIAKYGAARKGQEYILNVLDQEWVMFAAPNRQVCQDAPAGNGGYPWPAPTDTNYVVMA